jgi:parallel beta-helix repeat protein
MKKLLICFLVCMLVTTSIGVSVAGTVLPEQVSYPLTTGNILYVGGSGPNNYTKIQDAINDASHGDTVFVYDSLSPYVENIIINISINLVGENKNTTIIDGNQRDNVIFVTADGVSISGFTIINAGTSLDYWSGIKIFGNYTTISYNIIQYNAFGIAIWRRGQKPNIYTPIGNIISNNTICFNTEVGIHLICNNTTITHNVVMNNGFSGIHTIISNNNLISENYVTQNKQGISLYSDSHNNIINRNNITYNTRYGIRLIDAKNNIISNNNFFNSPGKVHASFKYLIWSQALNKWDGNYWDNFHGQYFYPIMGRFKLQNLIGLGLFPWINVDWNPAQEPYDIPGMT